MSGKRSVDLGAGFLRQTAAVLGKELRVELRTREILYTMVFFGLVIVVVFGFGLFEERSARLAAPGVLWTALLLAGTISVNRTFEREREGDCLTGLVLVPGIAPGLFVGKMLANLVFLLVTMSLVGPLVLIVFKFGTVPNLGGVIATVALGSLGYAVLGTLVGGMLGQVRMRAILLPLVLFPMVIPVFGIGVTATASLLNEGDAEAVRLEVDEGLEAGSVVELGLGGWTFGYEVAPGAQASRVEIAAALAGEVEAAVERAGLEDVRVSRGPQVPGLTLLSAPGTRLGELRTRGLQVVSRQAIESQGYSYLPVLAALDFLLLIVAMWLFGRLLEG